MKYFSQLILCLMAVISAYSQDPALAPFYHGVASGDALADRVIIWTRVTPDLPGTENVSWIMATDVQLNNVVQNGSTSTDSTKDYTVKIDVTGLQPDTWYYYQFTNNGRKSLIGRTKTLPVGDNQKIRAAIVSCQKYDPGIFYTAYLSIARRNDIQAVVHLGDYIYESSGGDTSGAGIVVQPAHTCITLDDYRQRYASYHLDPYLREAHQQYPFYTVWDDHEVINNAWSTGASGHNSSTQGSYQTRKEMAQQAYFEWIPIREQSPGSHKVYRTLPFGNLADFIMLDTRHEGRDQQASASAGYQDTSRTILGATQRQWFLDQLGNSQARWKIIGQQVMFAPLLLFGTVLNADQWDGYQGDRNRTVSYIMNNNIQDVVMLAGDIHSFWANDVPQQGVSYNASTGAGSALVEFVSSSISSGGFPFSGGIGAIQAADPHIKYAELVKKGYLILDIDTNRVQGDFVFMSTITDSSFTESNDASWYVNNGERFLRQAGAPAAALTNAAPLVPTTDNTVGIARLSNSDNLNISIYPNPFKDEFYITLKDDHLLPSAISLYDIIGKKVFEKRISGSVNKHKVVLDVHHLEPGVYLVTLNDGKSVYKSNVIKVDH